SCIVPIYCFMPEHLHVVLQGIHQRADTWLTMVRFKQKTGFWFGSHRPEVKWQKDFHDHIVRIDDDLGAHIRYIMNNPVRRGLVKTWDEYPFTGTIGVDMALVIQSIKTI